MPYYNQLAEAGRASGLLVFGHDHVGHGRSGGERVQVRFLSWDQENIIFFLSLQISDYADYTEPLLAHCREMKKTHPNLPLFLIGHSLGGLISLLSVLEAQVIPKKAKVAHFTFPGSFRWFGSDGSSHPPGSKSSGPLYGEPTWLFVLAKKIHCSKKLKIFCYRKVFLFV